jgi:hypothetical protein
MWLKGIGNGDLAIWHIIMIRGNLETSLPLKELTKQLAVTSMIK